MMDKIETWAHRVPDLVAGRWSSHWPPVAFGAILILIAFAGLIGGTIWAGGGIDRSERPMEYWIAVILYILVGGAFVLYI